MNLSTKRAIIPTCWKHNIDDFIDSQLLCANRYFAETHPLLGELINKTFEEEPQVFYKNLVQRWKWHHHFYEDYLEPALPDLLTEGVFEISPRQLDFLIKIYNVCTVVDQATLVYSAAIKKYVQNWINNSVLPDDEISSLITPQEKSFFIEYKLDHLKYFLELKNSNSSEAQHLLQNLLLPKYHIDDLEIFEGRVANFSWVHQLKVEEISSLIQKMESSIVNSRNQNHSENFINKIVTFDNRDEYFILRTFIGISGFVMRSKILFYLHETKIIQNNGEIYSLNDKDIVSGLIHLIDYRKSVLRKNVSGYIQTDYTCTSVCLMMVLSYYKLDLNSLEVEQRIHSLAGSKHTIGEHYSGIAKVACDYGLEVILIHSEAEEDLFSNKNQFIPENLFSMLMDEYIEYLDSIHHEQFKLECGVEITSDLLKNYLENDYLIILAGQLGQYGAFHSKLLVGYNEQGFLVIDPLEGKVKSNHYNYLNSFMRTQIGMWFIALRKNQSHIDRVLEVMDTFLNEANVFLAR